MDTATSGKCEFNISPFCKLLKNVTFSLMFACHMMGYWFDTFILYGRILHFTHHPIMIKVDESSFWRTIRTCICIERMCDICGISLMRMQKCYSSYMDGLLANSLWLIANLFMLDCFVFQQHAQANNRDSIKAPYYLPFVRKIYQWPVNSQSKSLFISWRHHAPLMFVFFFPARWSIGQTHG